jgi:hypothetical protein
MVAMTRNSYIPPVSRLLPMELDTMFCLSATSTEPYEDNGDYEWS